MSYTVVAGKLFAGPDVALAIYQRFLEALDTPVSLACWMQIQYREYKDLVSRKISERHYDDAASFRKDYQATSGLRKAAFIDAGIDRREAAVRKFNEAEESCKRTNDRFDHLMYSGGLGTLAQENRELFLTLLRAQKLIARILGPVPSKLDYRFGPGVTSHVKRFVTLPKKYSREIHVTPELYCYWRDICGPSWSAHVTDVHIVAASSIAFVGKDAKTDRSIGVEPHLNVYAQLGLGAVIRQRLRKWVDLDTGQDMNRFLASMAQKWDLCTIDLSSASDTIARSLVWFLLPEDWVDLLDRVRTHRFTLNGEEREFEKFSSMGNGFTFELESLIFYALTRAAGASRTFTTVYGDDIICEAAVFQDVVSVLEYCGFQVNTDKSFCHSRFYESCGHDYFDGVNVRPFFWKDLKTSSPLKWVNDIRRFSCHDRATSCLRYYEAWNFAVSRLPRDVQTCAIPYGYGDVGVLVDEEEKAELRLKRAGRGWCGWNTKAFQFLPDKRKYANDVRGYLAALDTGAFTSESPVRSQGIYQVGRFTTFGEWIGPGPWGA